MKIHAVKMLNHSTCFAICNKWGRNMRQISVQLILENEEKSKLVQTD